MTEKKSSRILTFDLLRGYFLVAIILDHLAFYPNGLDWWSGRGGLYVSAAEGFFLISGIVLGIVRGSKLIDRSFGVAAKLLLKRSVQLYITAIVLMLLFTFIGWFFLDNPGLKPGIRSPDENLLRIIWGALTFEYIYGWADYLRLYAIFILFSPIAVWLLRKKLWYVVLAVSIFIWTQFHNSTLGSEELSQVYSWQLIFFSGLIIGFHWDAIANWWRRLNVTIRKVTIGIVVSLAAVTMVTNFVVLYGQSLLGLPFEFLPAIHDAVSPFFDKEELPIPRLALFLLWFWASFWLFARFEKQIMRVLGWLLLPFGANSLYVYTLHAVLVFFVHLIITGGTMPAVVNFVLSVSIVLLIWLAVRYKVLMNVIPR
ncbi:MAG TPA: OpgC domain-containing protein [Candidatus Saccharimonadales bacterium]|nr:OpgC domain-containing protein [Candidatus Saccharimonadales bacterium]